MKVIDSSRAGCGTDYRTTDSGTLSGVTRDAQPTRPSRAAWLWFALIVALLAIRLPSLVQPAGGDQGLYAYAGQRMLAGDVMYRDMWDQKPPGIAALYAVMLRVWPHESLVPGADLVAAASVAWLLIVLGYRRYSPGIGWGAATMFLFLGDPYLQRMSGVYVRGQCEPFVSVAIGVSLVLLAAPARRRWHLFGAGLAFAAAFWLKYSGAYGVAVVAAVWLWRPRDSSGLKAFAADLLWVAAAFIVVAVAVLGYFAVHHALLDLRLATIDYNLLYSNETYQGRASALLYVFMFPVERARVDLLWFVGGIGALLLLVRARSRASTLVAFAWLASAILSIAINGHRDLPNYFVQANPALALAASAGLATVAASPRWIRAAAATLILAGIWRVGSDSTVIGLRLGSIPGLVDNVRFDLSYAQGRITREAYLSRFRGVKFDALEIDRLVRYVGATTDPGDSIYVFGFSGGSVCWKSDRRSSSRFYWSRPVLIEFDADRAGYGSRGLLRDLEARPPTVVALQKDEWRSRQFFVRDPALRRWLQEGYVLDHDTPMFEVWRLRHAT